jgi:hypothetical protein
MPKILVELHETYESITRPVVYNIVRDMIKRTGLPKDIRINYPGDIERAMQDGSSITSTHPEATKFAYTSQLTIEVDEQYQEDRLLSSAVWRPENPFIFRDDALGVGIKPVYGSCDTTVTVKFRARSKQQATRWRDEIKNRTAQGREQFVHQIAYHYLVPEEMFVVLSEIHRLRENVAGYDEDFATYFKNHRTSKARFLTDQAGRNGRWGIAESQIRVLGWFDWEGQPEQGSKEDDGSTWTIGFSYKFKYDKPNACAMQYPLIVHNQMIKYHPEPPDQPMYQIENQLRRYALSAKMFAYFETGGPMHYMQRRQGYQVPSYDEFIPFSVVPNTLRLMTALVRIDPANPRALFNLTDNIGGDIMMDPDIRCCLEKEWPYMTQPMQSIFNVSLYTGQLLQTPDKLTVDADLNVKTTFDMDLRQTYHVRISLVKNLRLIPRAALDRLRDCAPCLIKLLDAIDPTLKGRGLLPCIVGDTWVTWPCLEKAINAINGSTATQQNAPAGWNVGTLFIQTGRAVDGVNTNAATWGYVPGLAPADPRDDGCSC